MENKNYAVLIDSDNISPKYIEAIFEELSEYGKTPIRRLYGDFTKDEHWKQACLDFSLKQVHQFNYTTGKSATDSTMIIDTMDLLYKENYLDGFVIVSSDSDFTGLCQRLRESNKEVIGMGEVKTVEALIKACTSFKYLENLIDDNASTKSIQDKDPVIIKIKELIASYNGKMLVSQLKEQIVKLFNDFDCKNYGYNQISKFLNAIHGLKTEKAKDRTTLYVCLEDSSSSTGLESVRQLLLKIIMSEKKQQINPGQLQKALQDNGVNYKTYGFSKFPKFLEQFKEIKISKTCISLQNKVNGK